MPLDKDDTPNRSPSIRYTKHQKSNERQKTTLNTRNDKNEQNGPTRHKPSLTLSFQDYVYPISSCLRKQYSQKPAGWAGNVRQGHARSPFIDPQFFAAKLHCQSKAVNEQQQLRRVEKGKEWQHR
ncbi:NADH dehydrogenase-like protein SACOL0944 [Striga asiatica]|uniref:NADH dehydrogenase-like protein SACOL0944 n=1 Tax=Striga asiatica TaxID=4170 RepID=A0A5A7QE72_STRAF|nr:NADH dehydrogenase-like protein SACOL0944 [Striga asiatica]